MTIYFSHILKPKQPIFAVVSLEQYPIPREGSLVRLPSTVVNPVNQETDIEVWWQVNSVHYDFTDVKNPIVTINVRPT